jgi:glycine cleavage system H protein
VYVELPEVGTVVAANDKISEVESTKSVSDIYAPLGGTVTAVNGDLGENPQRLNEDPYGEGWICVIELGGDDGLDALLDADAYRKLIEA